MEYALETYLRGDYWLQDLLEQAKDLIQIVQVDGTLMHVNQAWAELLEYGPKEVQGKPIHSFIDEAYQVLYQQYRDRVIDGTLFGERIVFSLVAKSGRKVTVEGAVSVKRVEGKPVYTREIFRDISLRLQNEAELNHLNQILREREQNLQQLLLYAPDSVIVADQNSRITFWNLKAEQVFGWSSQEVLGQRLSDTIIPVQYREAHEAGMNRYLATGVAHVLNKTIEITALNKEGKELYVALTIARTTQRGQVAFIAFIRDISEQKQNHLQLEQKTKALAQFSAVAHRDLGDPLHNIISLAESIKADSYAQLPPASQQRLDQVIATGKAMNAALAHLLPDAGLKHEEQL